MRARLRASSLRLRFFVLNPLSSHFFVRPLSARTRAPRSRAPCDPRCARAASRRIRRRVRRCSRPRASRRAASVSSVTLFGILQQELAEIGRIPLGDAGSRGHDRRQTAAERFVDARGRTPRSARDESARRRPRTPPACRAGSPGSACGPRAARAPARAFHASSSAPVPATTRSTSHSVRRQSDCHASNTVSKPLRRSPSAPTNRGRADAPAAGRARAARPRAPRRRRRGTPPDRFRSRRPCVRSRATPASLTTSSAVRLLLQMTNRARASAWRSSATYRRCFHATLQAVRTSRRPPARTPRARSAPS